MRVLCVGQVAHAYRTRLRRKWLQGRVQAYFVLRSDSRIYASELGAKDRRAPCHLERIKGNPSTKWQIGVSAQALPAAAEEGHECAR